jgi:hypothetical protein
MKPIRFEICETNKVLVSHSGLAIAGAALGYTQMKKQFNQIRVPGKPWPDISHYDCILAMPALLCLSKIHCDDIKLYRQDFF